MENDNGTVNANMNGHENGLTNGAPETSAASAPADGVVQMDYSTDFPVLASKGAAGAAPAAGAWSRPVASKEVAQRFTLPATERSTKKSFGSTSEEAKIIKNIQTATGTRIELSESKDGSLTVVIKGLRGKVEEARSRLVRDLQTQTTIEVDIPKEHHGKLIGQGGSALRQLESETNTRIQIPNKDAATNIIKITGPRGSVDRAAAHIRSVSEKEAKLGVEHVFCPRILVPFVRGPHNEIQDSLTAQYNVKINIPPPSATSEMISITGEKDGVNKVAAAIKAIITEKQANCKSVTCQVNRTQHRYIVGQQRKGLHDILKETGVWVEVPEESENNDTITLRGLADRLGDALAMVYQRASSVITQQIKAATWLHKHLIGPKGSTLQALVPNRSKLSIDFDDQGVIFLEGSPEEVKAAYTILAAEVARLENEYAIVKVKAHPNLHRHVIGRGGALISKIKEETGVQIEIPNADTNSDEISIEGKKEGVHKAAEEIRAIVSKIENEKSRDIIVEQRLHKQIIGTKGEHVQKIREAHPNVVLSFPDINKKSDIINIRGDKNEVDAVYKKLQVIAKDLLESNYQDVVPIFKDFHKNIIGKGGATIRKIREETQTRIDLPDGNSTEERITVTGKKANVDKAIAELNKIQNELANIVTAELDIPVKIQSRLLGFGRRLVLSIQEECGGVHIKFPAEKSESTKVTIRGPKDDVEKAKKHLSALAKDKEQDHEDSLTAKPEYHRFLIGKGGAKVNKIRDTYNVRVMFPREGDADKELIQLLGKKEDVLKVKAELEEAIKQLNETVEITMDVDHKYHRHFFVRGAAVIKEIQEQNGGVSISFPKGDATNVTIKGSKQCVESAKQRIEEIIDNIDHQVTIVVEIAAQHHRKLLSNGGQGVNEIRSKFDVQIRFPDRRREGETPSPDAEASSDKSADEVSITGRDTNCEKAKEALLALVPVTQTIQVPVDMHRGLIGQKGATVTKLMNDFDVHVSIPKNNESDLITVSGRLENVEDCLEEIRKRIVKYEEEAEDRRLRAWELEINIPNEYHQRIIGPRGETVNKLRAKHEVQISLPRGEEKSDIIKIHGYEEKARACAAEIEGMVEELRTMFTQEITLDSRYHPRLIGQKGKNLKMVQDKYGVEIRLPRRDAVDPNLVVVAGKSEDAVYDCIDFLRNEEEEFMLDNPDRYTVSRRHEPLENQQNQRATVQMKNAPWQMDMEQFPDMSSSAAAPAQTVGGAWGGARRW